MTTNSPFKFLDSYTKADKDIFFGRDREIEQLYQKVFESKLLLVYGVSGTGKISLIECRLDSCNVFQPYRLSKTVTAHLGAMPQVAEYKAFSLKNRLN